MRKYLWIACVTLPLTACETVDSGDVSTGGIYAQITVTADGSGQTRVTTQLLTGGWSSGTTVDLEDGDVLLAYHDDETLPLYRNEDILGQVSYDATFQDDAAGGEYRVAFIRTNTGTSDCVGVSAPDSTVTLPAAFAITAPEDEAQASRSDDLDITWSTTGHSGDTISISLQGDCVGGYWTDVPYDAGHYRIDRGSLEPYIDGSDTCRATLTLTREHSGELDPHYGEGGYITSQQVRSIEIRSTP